jgi:hypothetical protein
MEKMHIMQADDPVFTRNAPITVGSVSRALGDAKEALASTGKLAERVEDVEVDLDELIARIEKSTAEHRALIQSIDSGSKATADSLAKLRAAIDTPGTLAKLADWGEAHLERLHKQHGHGSTLDEFKAQMAADHESFRKRDALTKYDFDDDGVQTFERRPESQWRIVR